MTTFIPLKSIIMSGDNPRTVPAGKDENAVLEASVISIGVINPISVIPGKKEGQYICIAGHRRIAAAIKAGFGEIPCTILTGDRADRTEEISFSENFARAQMHPADEFVAFKAASEDQGLSLKAIANRFAVSVKRVKRSLALANLSPRVIALWRDDEIDIDGAKAFSLGSVELQDRVIANVPTNQRLSSWYIQSNMDGDVSKAMSLYAGDEYLKRKLPHTKNLFGEGVVFHDAEAMTALVNELVIKELDFKGEINLSIDNYYHPRLTDDRLECDKAKADKVDVSIDWNGDLIIRYHKANPVSPEAPVNEDGDEDAPTDGVDQMSQALVRDTHVLMRKIWVKHVMEFGLPAHIVDSLAKSMVVSALSKQHLAGNELSWAWSDRQHQFVDPNDKGTLNQHTGLEQIIVANFFDPEMLRKDSPIWDDFNVRSYWRPDEAFLKRLKGQQLQALIIQLTGIDPANTNIDAMKRGAMTKKQWVEMAVQMFNGDFHDYVTDEREKIIENWRP